MKHHAFSPRATVAAAGIAVLLVGGTTTGAMADAASASALSAQQVTPTAPGVPTGLTAAPGNGTVTLSWSPPASDGGAAVEGYFIEGGTSPSSDDITNNVGGHTTTLGGLTNGTTYYFRVDAQNPYGDGPAATVEVTPHVPGSVPSRGSVPGAPTGLRTGEGDGWIALAWSAPTSAGGSPITGYHVYLGYNSSFAGAREFTTSGTSFRLTDASNGSLYYIKVTALNAAGEGPATPATSVIPTVHWPTGPRPPRPTGLTATTRHGEVILSWSPRTGGLQGGDGYLIYMGTSSGHEGATPAVPYLIENTTSYTIAPLKDGTRYYFQVALLNLNGSESSRSAEISAVPGISTGSGSGAGAGSGAGPGRGAGSGSGTPVDIAPGSAASAGSGASTGAGVPVNVQASSTPLPGTELAKESATGLPVSLVILLVALVLVAAAGGATAVVLLRRRNYDRRYGPVPPPRRPYDDQPAERFDRPEELNGPRSH